MNADLWRRVNEVLDAALAAPPEQMVGMVEHLCGGHLELRREALALLEADRAAGEFLLTPADVFAAPYLLALSTGSSTEGPELVDGRLEGEIRLDRSGERIGAYRLVRLAGRGGMGTVYLAERADGQFHQRVAVKLLKQGVETEEVVTRFLRERQILARLEHPHIARLLDGGVTEDGLPYLVMEYVDGTSITDYCDSHCLGIRERIALFEKVCRAVEYAHRNLVVHRDLKPSNVMIDGDSRVKLLDFGIAKLLDEETLTGMTRGDSRPMTPEYASPEQVRGGVMTTASDIYQLGLLLYELLAGERAHRLEKSTPLAIERAVCEENAARPSAVVTRPGRGQRGEAGPTAQDVSRRRATTPARLRKSLRGDLDTITLRALHKEPERRYPSAAALADDLLQYLEGRPVQARGDDLAYRASRFARRHRAGIVMAALLLGLSLGFGLLYTLQMKTERDQARLEAAKATQSAELFHRFFESWNPDAADRQAVSAEDLLRISVLRTEREMAGEPQIQAAMLSLLGGIYTNISRLDEAESLLTRARQLQELQGEPHLDLAATLNRLSELRYQQGTYDAAEAAYREALSMYRSLVGSSHPDTLRAQQGLANVLLQGQERFAEAEALFRDILTHYPAPAQDPSLTLADATRGLGLTLFFQARYGEAEGILRPALERHQQLFGKWHPVTILTMQALSTTVRDQGRVEEAEQLQRSVALANRQLYGPDHPNTIFSDFVLAFTLHRKGDFAAAQEINREVVARTARQHGEDHPLTGRYLRFHAYILLDRQNWSESERLLRQALQTYRTAHSLRHADEAGILNRLAYLLLRRDAPDAAAVYREALALHRSRPAGTPVFVTYGPHFLAWAMERMGEAREAEQLYRDSRRLYQEQLPADHPYRTATR